MVLVDRPGPVSAGGADVVDGVGELDPPTAGHGECLREVDAIFETPTPQPARVKANAQLGRLPQAR
jgi:hypothetical protein